MDKENAIIIESNNRKFELSPEIVKKYICDKATDSEIYIFLQICRAQNLNPFLREIYLIKYSLSSPATIVTGKEVFLKRAIKHPKYRGHRTFNHGSIKENNLTATCEVMIEGYSCPISVTVHYEEYVGYSFDYKTNERKPNKMWAEKPITMLKKVALVQAFREAFPDELAGLYDQAEINTIKDELPTKEIPFISPKNSIDKIKEPLITEDNFDFNEKWEHQYLRDIEKLKIVKA